jgi:hypothetical protein
LFTTRGGAIDWAPLEEDESEYDDEESSSSPGESDSEDADDEEIFSSPFLDSFQEEVHEIVQDYRSQVSQTFQSLKEEILREREQQREAAQAAVRPSKVRKAKPAPPMSADSSDTEEEEEEDEVAYVPPSSRRKRREQAPVLTSDAEDELIVGDTDEEDAYVLERLFGRQQQDDDSEEDSDSPAVEAEEPIELSRKQMEGSSKKKKKKSPKKKRKGRRASKKETVSDVQPIREQHAVRDDAGAASATLATANAPSAALANPQLYKSLIVSVSFLAIAILVNMAARILIKMLGKGS